MSLYHASTNKSLTLITPQPTLSHDQYIGDFVFATANRIMAIIYLARRGVPIMMNPEREQPNIVICSSVSDYKSKDKGGAIYELLSDSFIESPQKDLSMYEMVSKEAVKPINKTEYETSLSAMLENKIEVKFTDEYTFKKLINNPEQKRLIKAIKNYSI